MRPSLSQAAEEDLIRIYVEGARMFGLGQADRYLDGLEQALDFIGRNPKAARERREIDPPVRIHVYQSHIIIYVHDEGRTHVLRVRHGREDWQD